MNWPVMLTRIFSYVFLALPGLGGLLLGAKILLQLRSLLDEILGIALAGIGVVMLGLAIMMEHVLAMRQSGSVGSMGKLPEEF